MRMYAEARKPMPARAQAMPQANTLAHQQQWRHALLRAGVQPRLKVGAANDTLEREADAASERVLRMHKPPPASAPAPRQLQARAPAPASPVSPQLEASLNSLGSGGAPLDAQSRAFFEPRFGEDFSQVRLHRHASAARMADALGAKAFTLGNNIAFGASSGPEEKSLLGHELAHVVQQRHWSACTPQASLVQRWLPGEHKGIIEDTLGARVDKDSLEILKIQQELIDKEQALYDQPKHAMAGKIVPTGQELKKEEAIQIANELIFEGLTEAHSLGQKARETNDDMWLNSAMKYLGRAIHTLQDATSPTHSGFQTFEILAGPIPEPLRAISHATGETLIIKSEERKADMKRVTQWAYHIFLDGGVPPKVFDEKTGALMLPGGAGNASKTELQVTVLPSFDYNSHEHQARNRNLHSMPRHAERFDPNMITLVKVNVSFDSSELFGKIFGRRR